MLRSTHEVMWHDPEFKVQGVHVQKVCDLIHPVAATHPVRIGHKGSSVVTRGTFRRIVGSGYAQQSRMARSTLHIALDKLQLRAAI